MADSPPPKDGIHALKSEDGDQVEVIVDIEEMPYNNTPIAPPGDITGTVSLPLARVKKIIHADEDVHACSNNAAFVIAVAAEMFVRYLVERTHDMAKSDKKPRRNIQYKDVANAVARFDNLEFLSDVVPRTITYKKYLEDKTKRDAAAAEKAQKKAGEQGMKPEQGEVSTSAPNHPADQHDADVMEIERPSTANREFGVERATDVEMRDGGPTNGTIPIYHSFANGAPPY